MHTKLTLRLEDQLIEQAKQFARQHNKSISQVVADYFQALNQLTEDDKMPPITQSLIGVIPNTSLTTQDYKQHLEKKYL